MTKNTPAKTALEVVEVNCTKCGRDHAVVSIKLVEAGQRGYDVGGRVAHCPTCGMAIQAAVIHVPAELGDLTCPKCNKEHLQPVVSEVTENKPREYAFAIEYHCSRKVCGFTQAVPAFFKGFWQSVKRVSLGLHGASIEPK